MSACLFGTITKSKLCKAKDCTTLIVRKLLENLHMDLLLAPSY